MPIIGAPRNWLWCLLPLLLLPLLLFLLRKRRFFATADFVEEMVEIGESELLMPVQAPCAGSRPRISTS